MALTVDQYVNIGSGWFSATTPRSSTGIVWEQDDWVVIVGGAGTANNPLGNPTNANLSFGVPKVSSTTGGDLECNAYIWAAQAASAQTGQSIQGTKTSGSDAWGHAALVIGGAPTGFANAIANLTESAISRTVSAGSVGIYGLFDWNATNPPGKTPLAGSGTAVERLDQGDGVNYGMLIFTWEDMLAGTYNFGPNNYTSLKAAQVFIEILAPAGAAAVGADPLIVGQGAALQRSYTW